MGGVPVRAGSRRLRAGELLEVELGPGRPLTRPRGRQRAGRRRQAQDAVLLAPVVFADEHLVVVDKPAGLVVHPGAGNRQGTLVQQLLVRFPDISTAGPDDERPGIVQRLDKGTSGLIVVARNPEARQGLVAQLAARSVERRYLAVVYGELEADDGVVEAPLGRSPRSRLKIAVVEGGRQARDPLPGHRPFSFAPAGVTGDMPAGDGPDPSGAAPISPPSVTPSWPTSATPRPASWRPRGGTPRAPAAVAARGAPGLCAPGDGETDELLFRAAGGPAAGIGRAWATGAPHGEPVTGWPQSTASAR